MYILGIETSLANGSLGLFFNDRPLELWEGHQETVLSRDLVVEIKRILDNNRLLVKDLGKIVLSSGPGSYNGLRVGYAVAKAIALPFGIPITEVSVLDLLAAGEGTERKVVSLAFRGNLHYCKLFEGQERYAGNEGQVFIKTLEEIEMESYRKRIAVWISNERSFALKAGFFSRVKIKTAIASDNVIQNLPNLPKTKPVSSLEENTKGLIIPTYYGETF
jgi:tRNA threonylcarbamoyl adenosine modification protein YeaZ